MNAFTLAGAPEWFQTLLNLSLQATLLAGLVWVALKVVGRWIAPSWRALMWFLVIARVLIPYAPASRFSLQNLFTNETTLSAVVVQAAVQDSPDFREGPVTFSASPDATEPGPLVETTSSLAAPLSSAQTKPISYTRVFTVIWGGVACFCVVLLLARAFVIRHRLVRHGVPATAFVLRLLEGCRVQLRSRYPTRVTASDRIVAPALTGLIPARLIVPTTFEELEFSVAQIRQILLHELAHIQQGHLWLHWLTLIARAIHWFNPAIHFAATRMRLEFELAADAAVLRNCTSDERAEYGETILKVLASSMAPPTLLALGMAEETRNLKERLSAMAQPRRPGSYALAIVLLSGLIISGLSSASPTSALETPTGTSEVLEPSRTAPLITNIFSANIQVETNRVVNEKIPVLGDIPFLGRLFRSERATNETNVSGQQSSSENHRLPASMVINEARTLIELGRLAEAQTLLKRSIQQDPDSRAAKYYLDLIQELRFSRAASARQITSDDSVEIAPNVDWFLGNKRIAALPDEAASNHAPDSAQPIPAAKARTAITKQKQGIYRKLESVRIDDFPVVLSMDLVEVLKELGSEIRKRDSSGRGINLIISNGSSQGPSGTLTIDVEKFQIKFDPPVRDLTLGQFFDALVRVAEPPPGSPPNTRLKYTVEDYAIVFSRDVPEGEVATHKSPNSGQSSNSEGLKSLGVPSSEIPQPGNKRMAAGPDAAASREPAGSFSPELPKPIVRVRSTMSAQKQGIYRRLDSIRIDDFPIAKEVDLRDLLKDLNNEIRKADQGGRGLNFILAMATDIPDVDPGDFKIKFDPPIRDVTLGQFLDAILVVAKAPQEPPATVGLRYSVQDYAIVFSPRKLDREPFVSRTFKINPNTFKQGLEGMYFAPNPFQGLGPVQQSGGARGFFRFNGNRVATPGAAASAVEQVRRFFSASGVDFLTNTVAIGADVPAGFGLAAPGQVQQKALFYNDRSGVLFARGTERDLDAVENALHAINFIPPAVSVSVEIFEISNEEKTRFEKDLEVGQQTPVVATNEFLFVAPKAGSGEAASPAARNLRDNLRDALVITNVPLPGTEAVLSADRARALSRRLKSTKGVDAVAAPNVTTLVGKGARISIEETRNILTPSTARSGGVPVTLGWAFDCFPEKFDGVSVQLNSTVSGTEFLEYDRAGDNPLPKFRIRSIGSRAKVAPGSAQALWMPLAAPKRVPVLGDIAHLGQLFENNESGRYVLILITPVFVDPAGNIVLPKQE